MPPVLVLNYGGRTFTFTKERLVEAMEAVTKLVIQTKGEFSYKDAAKVHRMMHDIAWSTNNEYEATRLLHYKVKVTRWSTGTTITMVDSSAGDKFESMSRISWKWSQQYGSNWDIDVSVLDTEEADRIVKQMQGVFCDD